MLRNLVTLVRSVAMSVQKPEVVFVLGGPGSGKGTLCQKIVDNFGYVHLSAGDLLREERAKPGSQFGELIENHIRNGTIVPVEITCSLLVRAMDHSDNIHKRFLIDGFPRNQDNVEGWNKEVGDKVDLKAVIFLECAEEVCTQRCLDRGAKGSGRSDDNKESLVKRFNTYINDSLPIIRWFDELKLVHKFDAMQTPDEVFADVCKMLKEINW